MRLAASNIAWKPKDDAAVAQALSAVGFEGVELAPTAVWERPLEVPASEVQRYRALWESRGLRIVALQALLFGRPELQLFGDAQVRRQLAEHLLGMIRLGGQLGAGALVFGSPKNRPVGTRTTEEAYDIAVPFFRELGAAAHEHGTALCIEPNPTVYGCDWITTSVEGLELVRRVDSPGFRLHLDAGGMTLSGESPGEATRACFAAACHFHASEPQLAPVGTPAVAHGAFAQALAEVRYKGWVSIEMRSQPNGEDLPPLRSALDFVSRTYGPALS
ncbi:sugar phosphate isomerase/epimerase family protein [Cystobacter fuscus]